jgi:secreted trypsin-like serine protease
MSCPGDSGGPYMYRPSPTSRPEVIGIVSYGPELACGEPGNFDVATSVVYWRKWINNMFVKYNLTR